MDLLHDSDHHLSNAPSVLRKTVSVRAKYSLAKAKGRAHISKQSYRSAEKRFNCISPSHLHLVKQNDAKLNF